MTQSTISHFFGNHISSTSLPKRPKSKSGGTNKNKRKAPQKTAQKAAQKAAQKPETLKSNVGQDIVQDIDQDIAKEIKKIVTNENYKGKEKEYIESLTAKERYAMFIAYEELETSFNISKSIGYVKWLKTNK